MSFAWRRANDIRHVINEARRGRLEIRQIDRRMPGQLLVLNDVVDDADDGEPVVWARVVLHRNPLPDGVLTGPHAPGNRLADHHAAGRARAVDRREVAPRGDADPERADV